MRWYNIRRYALMLLLGLLLLLALLLGGGMTQGGLHLALNAAARWVPGWKLAGWRGDGAILPCAMSATGCPVLMSP